MLVKMTTPMEGPGESRRRGQDIEVSDAEGIRLIKAGFAIPVRDEPPVETTAKKPARRRKKG